MRRPIQTLLLVIASLCVSTLAAAAGDDNLTVGVHQSRRVLLHGSAATVVVGDPKVADVAMIDAHSVIIMGKAYGATQLIVTDHAGRVLLDGQITVSGQDTGRMTLYRGTTVSDYACTSTQCRAIEGASVDNGAVAIGGPVAPTVAPPVSTTTTTTVQPLHP